MRNKLNATAGFTLIEAMIVVVIIGIFASMAGPAFTNYIPKMKLRADAREKTNYLRQARSRAISENGQYGIYFDTDSNEIKFFEDLLSPELATYDESGDSLVMDPISCESNVMLSNSTFTSNVVVFYSNGSASTSGQIDLVDSESGDSYTIDVLASTGRIKLQ